MSSLPPGSLPPDPPAESRWACLIRRPRGNVWADRVARCRRPRLRRGNSLRIDQLGRRSSVKGPIAGAVRGPTALAVIVTRLRLTFRNTTAQVLLDRRVGERWQSGRGPALDHRRADGWARPSGYADLKAQGSAIVRTS